MSFAGLNTAHNLSFYAIPVAWGVAIAPHFYAVALYNKERAPGTEEWDNKAPKKNITTVKEAKLSPAMQEKYLRAEAANENSFVNLPFFIAAVLAGNMARLEPKLLNTAVAVYLASRLAYSWAYINGSSKAIGNIRTASFLVGVFTCLSLFVKAGNTFYTGYASFGKTF